MKPTIKKIIFIGAIPIILITALLDTWILGRMTWKEYIFQCAWEYTIFWTGFWLGEKMLKKKYGVE